ncbi:MAG: hypothetical protein ACJAVO_002648 [Parvibaculaceae bacterium]|jgi:hypothetical protein
MNTRLYDPEIGRFVSPDPYIQYAEDSQSYNRYAYARNNPLSITAPSGNFFFTLSAIISFAISAVSTYLISQLPFIQDLLSNPVIAAVFQIAAAYAGGVQGAALAAIAVSSANGGSIGDAIKAAAVAAATAGAFEQVGSWVKAGEIGTAGKVALHAAVGCASAAASGGKCAAGAAAAGFSAAAGSIIPGKWSKPVQVGARSVIGGVAAELGGGKFANGAVTAAFGYLFNDLLHPDDKPRKMEGNTEICSEGCNVVNVNVSGGVAGEVGASYLKVYDKVTGLQHELWTGDLSASFGGFTKIPASLVMSVEWGRITSAVSLSDLSGWGLTTSATHVWSGGDSCKRFQWIVGTSGYDNWPGRRVFRWRFRRNDLYQL